MRYLKNNPLKLIRIAKRMIKGYFNMDRFRACKYMLKLKKMGKNVSIRSGVKIFHPERVELGDNVTIYENVLIYGGGYDHGYVKIGDKSHIAPFSVINGEGGVIIGNKVGIGSGVKIHSLSWSTHDSSVDMHDAPRISGEIVIENNVLVATNSSVILGVRIGTGSVVGAGAVVTKDIPANSVAVGVPAKVIKKR